MTNAPIDLGEQSDVAAISGIAALPGLSLADVGCGPGDIARALVAAGAKVIAAEPDPIQAARNREAPPLPGLQFIEARAESLPIAAASVDGVCFFRSLHHVPIGHMDAALAAAARLLKPDTGFLYVVEPGMTGTHFPVMRPYHDETHVRTMAQAALARTAAPLFRSMTAYRYTITVRYPNFEAMVARMTSQTFTDIRRDQIDTAPVRRLFEAGRTPAGDYAFDQPMLIALYRGPMAAG